MIKVFVHNFNDTVSTLSYFERLVGRLIIVVSVYESKGVDC